jgi:hypothetical protein
MKYYHIHTKAEHNEGYPPLQTGTALKIGSILNPYYSRIQNSATRTSPGITTADISRYYSVMLREVVFENLRLREYPVLPSRTTCLWVSKSLEDARYWFNRIPFEGDKKILEIEVHNGSAHEAWEGHLTNFPENIIETQERARKYWSGRRANDGRSEVLVAGDIKIMRTLA